MFFLAVQASSLHLFHTCVSVTIIVLLHIYTFMLHKNLQADEEAQQACLAKRKLQKEKQQLAKELQGVKAGQAPQQARLQQMYGELEVARSQLAEGKLRINKLNETIQQVRRCVQAGKTGVVWGVQSRV
jgi:peptidoglycan hydrolase CwlO-like protein